MMGIVTGLILSFSTTPRPSRMWRNWQTRRLQVPVPLWEWRFDSSHPHYTRTEQSHRKNCHCELAPVGAR
jgi:hypothetical protein